MARYFHIDYEFSREQALERIDARCARQGMSDPGVTQPQRSEDGRSRIWSLPAGPQGC